MSPDRTEEWRVARQNHPPVAQPRNEQNETISQCEARLKRDHGVEAERIASVLAMQYGGSNHEYPRNEHLIAFYRVIARLVRIDA